MRVVLNDKHSPTSDTFVTGWYQNKDGGWCLNHGAISNAVVFSYYGFEMDGEKMPKELHDKVQQDYTIVPVKVVALS